MKKIIVGVALAIIGFVGTAAGPVEASVKCSPDVHTTNGKAIAVKVLKFKYKITGSNTVYTEDISNTILTSGGTKTWSSQTLGSAALGVVISSTAVEYQDDTGAGWGPVRTSAWFPHTFACGDNHTYFQTIN